MRFLGQVGIVAGGPGGGGFGGGFLGPVAGIGPGGGGGAFLGPVEGNPMPESGPITNNGPFSVSAGPATGAPIYPVINFVCRPGKKDGLNLVCGYEESSLPAWGPPMGLAWSNAPIPGW
jgi:hypothetical protein